MCAHDGEHGQGCLMPGADSAHPGGRRDCGVRHFLGAAPIEVGPHSLSSNPALPHSSLRLGRTQGVAASGSSVLWMDPGNAS